MKTFVLPLLTFFAGLSLVSSAAAKDKPVQLAECPAAVQTVIQQYSAKGTLEEIGLDEKKKSGGPAVYEAKFTLADGNRIEVHIAADGRVITEEKKKAKK
ncbi:MAG: hypothetical protein EOP84_33145 [Verrucomicrobiaceae bacterium]|nr:MAG: hypothetical protein EOP84_33145 [Verrucomicrobiaceae bacterium]